MSPPVSHTPPSQFSSLDCHFLYAPKREADTPPSKPRSSSTIPESPENSERQANSLRGRLPPLSKASLAPFTALDVSDGITPPKARRRCQSTPPGGAGPKKGSLRTLAKSRSPSSQSSGTVTPLSTPNTITPPNEQQENTASKVVAVVRL